MAWNQPGGNGEKNPWGKRRPSSQVDLDEVLRNLQNRLRGIFGGGGGGDGDGMGSGGGSGIGLGLIAVVAVAIWLLTGFYVIQQGERGVVLRFGEKNTITEAGLHWRLPFPIESVEKVNVEKVSTVEIGYRSNPRTGGKNKVPKEALMLTEDENILDIEFAVQYKVKDAAAFLFNVKDQEMTISQATESAVREVVGKSTLDFALTEGRDEVSRNSKELLQTILDKYESGILIVAVETQKAQPPEEVKSAFDDAVKAREDEQRLKNEAEAYANDIIPRARGAAARLVEEAEGYKASTIARADGDARRFSQVASEFVKAPAVTRERLYIETMETVLSNTTKIFVDQKGGNNLIYLPLDKLIPLAESGPRIGASSPESDPGSARTESGTRSRPDLRSRSLP